MGKLRQGSLGLLEAFFPWGLTGQVELACLEICETEVMSRRGDVWQDLWHFQVLCSAQPMVALGQVLTSGMGPSSSGRSPASMY